MILMHSRTLEGEGGERGGQRKSLGLRMAAREGLVSWGRSSNELGSRIDNAYSCSGSCKCRDAEWWCADAGADEWAPAVAAGGYKGRSRESGGWFALLAGVPGSGRGQGYASR